MRSRRAVERLYENKAQLNSISMHLGESVGMIVSMLQMLDSFLFCMDSHYFKVNATC